MLPVQSAVYKHLRSNWFIYTIILTFFVAGVTVGSFGVKYLSPDQATDLSNYVDIFLNQLDSEKMNNEIHAYQVIKDSLIFIGCLYILGLTIIGFPIVLGLLFIKGFKLGFTVGFLVKQKALKGIIFALLSILPQNLLYIPVVIVAGVTSLGFSFLLFKALLVSRRIPLPNYFLKYTFYMVVLSTILVVAGFLEAYVTPVFMKAVVTYIS